MEVNTHTMIESHNLGHHKN